MTNNAKPKADAQTPGLELKPVELSRITGLHSVIESLWRTLSVPPLRMVPSEGLSTEEITEFLSIFPLRAGWERNRLRCTGNIRLFQLARSLLDDSTVVPCIVEDEMSAEALRRRALTEIIWGPALLGAHFRDAKLLVEVGRRAIEAGYLTLSETDLEVAIAQRYGVDRRQLKRKQPANVDVEGPMVASAESGEGIQASDGSGTSDHEPKATDPQ